METRIRQFRRSRGWTLQQVADRIGTTAQTIQRLETANMTVSVEWLQRFADVFGIHPADLIAGQTGRDIPMIGVLGKGAAVREAVSTDEGDGSFAIDVPAEQPVAIRVDDPVGDYRRGMVLIASKLTGPDIINAVGRDALVGLRSGRVLLRRIIKGQGDSFTLVPLQTGGEIRYDQQVEWAGRIVMAVRYL